MQDRRYRRLRDALLDYLSSVAKRNGLAPLRGNHHAGPRGNVHGGAHTKPVPSGDLVVVTPSHVIAVVDVGARDGVASILRCWRHLAEDCAIPKPHVVLFYIAIVRPEKGFHSQSSWQFARDRAMRDLGQSFEACNFGCTPPLLGDFETISPNLLDTSLAELRGQGCLGKMEALLGRDAGAGTNVLGANAHVMREEGEGGS